ncbi:hypothetical protein BX616_011218 [Lobosporangium transversale]|nr:hypothetical protein BX616_011218 [Lobosporangium transversale]
MAISQTHERKHTGERPFKCMYPGCDKTFTQLGNLKTHERIHDQVKRFLCPLADCGKTFNQFGNLKTHTTKMHPDMIISDEELASKVVVGSPRIRSIHAEPALCGSQKKKQAPRHVVTHFNPYQRRPIHPLQSEADFLLREIQAMIRYQEQHGIKPSATTDQESGVMED